MFEKVKNYAYYAAVILFFFLSVELWLKGGKYSGFSPKHFEGTKFGLLITLNAIGGYVLSWLGALGFVIATYIYKNL